MKPTWIGAVAAKWRAWSGRVRPLRVRASALGLIGLLVLAMLNLPAAAGLVSADSGTAGLPPQDQVANGYGPLGSLAVTESVGQSVYGSAYGGAGGGNGSYTVTLPTPPTYPTPPADFLSQVQAMADAAMAMERANPFLAQAEVTQQTQGLQTLIASLTPQELALMYHALQQTSGWQGWTGTMQAAAAQLAAEPANVIAEAMAAGNGSAGGASTLPGATQAAGTSGEPAGQSPSAQQSITVLTGPPGGFNPPQAPPDTCPPAAPGGPVAIAALEVTADGMRTVKLLVPQLLALGAVVLGEGTEFTIPDPVWDVFELIESAVDLTAGAFDVIQSGHDSCESDAHSALLVSLYNNLATTQAEVLGQTTTILNDVVTLEAVVNSRTTTILTTLSDLNQQFNSQIGTVLNSQNAMTQLINNVTIAQQAADQQQVTYEQLQLQLTIEQNLSTGQGNMATLELPASAGGYLDSQPVGVQEIVTKTVDEMQQAGETVDPDALQDLSNANAALAAGNYKLAYAEYRAAYQTLTAVTMPTSVVEPPGQSGSTGSG